MFPLFSWYVIRVLRLVCLSSVCYRGKVSEESKESRNGKESKTVPKKSVVSTVPYS